MFQFSKNVYHHGCRKDEYWPVDQTPKQYFAHWITWFNSKNIKTEIRKTNNSISLWREDIDATTSRDYKKLN